MLQVDCSAILTENGFKHNTAANGGAAFLNAADEFLVLDNNFTSNTASQGGSALQIQSTKEVQISGNIFRRC